MIPPKPIEKVDSYGSNWAKVTDRNNIQVYERPMANSPVKEFIGITMVDARMEVAGMVLNDVASFQEWMPGCIESDILKRFEEFNYIVKYVYNMPWPVNNKEVIMKATTTLDWNPGKIIVDLQSIDDYPKPNSVERFKHFSGKWIFQYENRNKTKVTFLMHFDPDVQANPGIINAIANNYPYDAFVGLKRMVKKEKYIEQANAWEDKQ